MKFKMIHENYNVQDLEKSMAFYEKALGLTERRRKEAQDGSFIIVYVGNEETDFELELTWLRDHPDPYDIGERSSIWHFGSMIMKQHTSFTRKWDASALRIRPWGFISFRIRTATGWK